MNGIRDLSIISTPPARRLSIKTFVRQKDDLVVREAVLREICGADRCIIYITMWQALKMQQKIDRTCAGGKSDCRTWTDA
ncbi:transcription-repair-coupling factor [Rodentibacter pneumotropicus]|uniref:Transcription-repair-coupling factor n=1 Tax=Rodentibacter pneumotropicus TaxID=758 RepID=A0A448MR81_9PAST|nr:transcription-repair-coupling factor [Rodentibacter pneumotropicus]